MSQNTINPFEAWANEELTEAELDAFSGGQLSSDLNQTIPDFNQFFKGDVKIVPKVDSSYTSYQGALGTKGNESNKFHSTPLDITVNFP